MSMNDQIGQSQTEMNVPEHPSTASKVGNYFLYVALGVVGVAVAIVLLWLFAPNDVLKVNNSPVPVRTIREHPTADGVIILKVDFCKNTDAVGRVRTSFTSPSREIFLPVGEDKQAAGCEVREVPILIPHEIPGGKYKVKFRIDYEVNPIKTVTEEFESLEFEVAETEVR